MNGGFAVSAVMGRIDQIRRTIGIRHHSRPQAFSHQLEAAIGAARTEDSTTVKTAKSAPPAVASSAPHFTLGGRPVPTTVVEAAYRKAAAWAPAAFDGDVSDWSGLLPERGQAMAESIDAAARRAGLDPRLLASVVWAESTFVPDAVSSAGAIGLAQLMPGTAAGLGVDPWDPEANLEGGATYLAMQIDRFGTVDLGLAAYNAGPGRVIETGGAPSYTHDYIDRVRGYYERLGGTP